MSKEKNKIIQRTRRRFKIRAKIKGTKECPRLSVFRSSKILYVQLIDDEIGKTVVSVNSREIKVGKKDLEKGVTIGIKTGLELGKLIAQKAKKAKVEMVVFDRGGYKYHGRIKAVADGARAGGLEF
ncbi:50S ribosomal protein L18 [bacterium]|nr:50S ribosomal protein L18 [bacterium]